jgi:hypothetical protein
VGRLQSFAGLPVTDRWGGLRTCGDPSAQSVRARDSATNPDAGEEVYDAVNLRCR